MMLKQSRNFKCWKAKASTTKEPFTTTENDARLDIEANGLLGGRFSRTFFDVKFSPHMLNPALKLYLTPTNIMSVKTLKYQQKVLDVEHSS